MPLCVSTYDPICFQKLGMFHLGFTLFEKVAPLNFRKIENFPKIFLKGRLFFRKIRIFLKIRARIWKNFRKIFNFPKMKRRNFFQKCKLLLQ
jgi:hypothetical protein